MPQKIDFFYETLTQKLISKLGVCSYKNIDVTPLTVKFYTNEHINSIRLITEIEQLSSDLEMTQLVEKYYNAFFVTQSLSHKFVLVFKDIFRYLYYQLIHTGQEKNADFYVFITNKKFFSFISPVKEALEQQGKKVDFLLWDLKDNDAKIKNIHFPKTAFPQFWKKGYCQHHEFVSLVDRAYGFLPLIKNKKIIVIEGCTEAQHVLGLLGKKNDFKTFVLQWGFFGKTATKSGWRTMPFDVFLVWGDFFSNAFKKYNPDVSLIACGHPTLKQNKVSVKEKVILFAVQKQFGEHITTTDVIRFIHFAAKISKQMRDYKVIIRSHPDFVIPENIKQEYEAFENIVWHDYNNYSLNESFEAAKYCVSISSTVSLESVAFGCYPIYLKINTLPLQIQAVFSEHSNFKHIFDFENFTEGIRQLDNIDFNYYLSEFKSELYKNLGNEAVAAIVSQLKN